MTRLSCDLLAKDIEFDIDAESWKEDFLSLEPTEGIEIRESKEKGSTSIYIESDIGLVSISDGLISFNFELSEDFEQNIDYLGNIVKIIADDQPEEGNRTYEGLLEISETIEIDSDKLFSKFTKQNELTKEYLEISFIIDDEDMKLPVTLEKTPDDGEVEISVEPIFGFTNKEDKKEELENEKGSDMAHGIENIGEIFKTAIEDYSRIAEKIKRINDE